MSVTLCVYVCTCVCVYEEANAATTPAGEMNVHRFVRWRLAEGSGVIFYCVVIIKDKEAIEYSSKVFRTIHKYIYSKYIFSHYRL